ncbi:hypothetical protein F5887DRAFT_898654, partial [Amanita rubescens]
GPENTSLKHFHKPIPTVHKGKSRWSFKCKYCDVCVTVPRTQGKESFDAESPKPPLGNCATHIRKKHPNAESDAAKVMTNNGTVGMPAASVKLMADFLKEGKLNPEHVPTQKGFLKVFAAWVTEDDLPFTTGESPGLQLRNQITRIFGEMRDRVKAEMKAIDMWVCDDENLRHLLLSNNEWNHLEKLAEVLKVFTQVTQVISSAGTPTLPWIIPMYELMQRHLSSKADMRSLPFEIQSACREALGKLDKYYIIAVNCQYNILATRVMYFQKLGAERVRKAKILFEHVYEQYKTEYDAKRAASADVVPDKVEQKTHHKNTFLDLVCMENQEISLATPPPPHISETERFFAIDKKTTGFDDPMYPLPWWKVSLE